MLFFKDAMHPSMGCSGSRQDCLRTIRDRAYREYPLTSKQ